MVSLKVILSLVGGLTGEPIIPYIFLLCVEGLSALIKKIVEYGHVGGIAVYRGGPKLSHLFFVDDSLIFL